MAHARRLRPRGGVIGIFGVPTVHEDDALRAVRAASEARDALLELRHELERDSEIAIALRSGVNTGDVVADTAAARTLVAGDAVNVAARLQQAADPGEILLDEQTERLVRDAVRTERVDPAALEGNRPRVGVAAARTGSRSARLPATARDSARRTDGRARAAAALLRTGGGAAGRQALHDPRPCRHRQDEAREGARSVPSAKKRRCFRGTARPTARGSRSGRSARSSGRSATLRRRSTAKGTPTRSPTEFFGAVGLSGRETTNEETLWAARKLFEALARRRPLVVLLEDAHWAEPAVLDLVEHIVEWSSDAPIVFVCLGRSGASGRRGPGWPVAERTWLRRPGAALRPGNRRVDRRASRRDRALRRNAFSDRCDGGGQSALHRADARDGRRAGCRRRRRGPHPADDPRAARGTARAAWPRRAVDPRAGRGDRQGVQPERAHGARPEGGVAGGGRRTREPRAA